MLPEDQRSFISSVTARSFRGFDDLHVRFNSRFSVLTGPNGAGKSTVIRAIAACFSDSVFQDVRVGDSSEFWVDANIAGKPYRIGHGAGAIRTAAYRGTRLVQYVRPPSAEESRQTLATQDYMNQLLEGRVDLRPITIGPNRNLDYLQTPGVVREKAYQDAMAEYRGRDPFGHHAPQTVKQWLINRYFVLEKPWAAEFAQNWAWTMGKLAIIAPEHAQLHFVRIEQDLEPVFSAYGRECYLEELSAGFQSVLSIVVTIVDWIERGQAGSRSVETATGVAMIDELDLHLHPEWQQQIRGSLLEIFPNVQFIVTSHSPQIVASCEEGEVIRLPGGLGGIEAEPTMEAYFAWSFEEILKDVLRTPDRYNERFDDLVAAIERTLKSRDVGTFDSDIEQMAKHLHPSDPLIALLKIKRAQEILREDSADDKV